MKRIAIVLIALSGCLADGPTGGNGTPDAGTIPMGTGPFCAVATIFATKCTTCHKTAGQAPNLEFESAKTSIVGVTSGAHTYVTPSSSATSFLYKKLAGPLEPTEGVMMPIGFTITAEEIDTVKTWIDSGASTDCTAGGTPPPPPAKYHPAGYDDPVVHSFDLKFGVQDCRMCHGAELTGGAGPSCDSCHMPEWRTTCTYCHGGTDNTTGAPPRDLDGTIERDALRFRAHTEHASERNHAPFDCIECHTKPTDVLSMDHIFGDATPGEADVNFAGGLSAQGVYNGGGSCSNLYCHGNGRTGGGYDHLRARPDCNTCHEGPGSLGINLSGRHRKHIEEGIRCTECHGATVDMAGMIIDPARHVNGRKDLALPAGITRGDATCNGTCHMERHQSERWQ